MKTFLLSLSLILMGVGVGMGMGVGASTPCGMASTTAGCFVDIPPCASRVYCQGPILAAFQSAGLFNDSKSFVDCPLLPNKSIHNVIMAFQSLTPAEQSNTTLLHALFHEFFAPPGSDLQTWVPPDWVSDPPLIDSVAKVSPEYGNWVSTLNQLWRTLGRKVDPDVTLRPSAHTLLGVPNGFIVAGGRFREWYYWDTYWIIQGLLRCGLHSTVAGMLENFAFTIDRYGHIPNGGRLYYIDRSQPPLFTLMVDEYYAATNDLSLVEQLFPEMEAEYAFWMSKRVGRTQEGILYNIYRPAVGMPRPEGYNEDVAHARGLDPVQAACLYSQLAAGAETGWDFSSRWFADPTDISSICVSSLAPIDLNAYLYKVELTLASLARALGKESTAVKYDLAAERRASSFHSLFWNADVGLFVDYNASASTHVEPHSVFYASSLIPVWAGLCGPGTPCRAALPQTLADLGVLSFPGGIPTSFLDSSQQWDMPNAWAPLQYFAILALEELDMASEAESLAHVWLASNYAALNTTGYMFEKYDALHFGSPGGGGEYSVVTGFGWTNGVALTLLERYFTTTTG